MNPNDRDPKTVDEVAETCVKTAGALVDRLGPFLGTLYEPIDLVLMAVVADARRVRLRLTP